MYIKSMWILDIYLCLLKSINNADKVLVKSDKTRSFYKLKAEDCNNLIKFKKEL